MAGPGPQAEGQGQGAWGEEAVRTGLAHTPPTAQPREGTPPFFFPARFLISP